MINFDKILGIMKIYSGQVCLGECGTPTNLYDDYCSCEGSDSNENIELKPIPNLYIGDIVMVMSVDAQTGRARHASGLGVVVAGEDDNVPYIMGLKSVDFSTDNDKRAEWLIKKVKGWEDCVENEIVPECARIIYRKQ